jgi:hypothetical protein
LSQQWKSLPDVDREKYKQLTAPEGAQLGDVIQELKPKKKVDLLYALKKYVRIL